MILFFYYSKWQDQVQENTWLRTHSLQYRPNMTIVSCWTWRVSSSMVFRLFRIQLPRYMFDNILNRYLHRYFHTGRKLVRLRLQIILQDRDPSQVSCASVDVDMQDDQEWSVLQLSGGGEKLSSLQSKNINCFRLKNQTWTRCKPDPNLGSNQNLVCIIHTRPERDPN